MWYFMCIEIDNILVNVEIVRKNNKNTYMRVKNGVLVVTTNYMVSDRKIKEIIINNKNSIIKMLEKDNKLNEKNNYFYLFGKKYDVVYGSFNEIDITCDKIYVKNEKELNKIQTAYKQLAVKLQLLGVELNKDEKAKDIQLFLDALADDLNTSNALTQVFSVVKEINQILRTREFDVNLGYEKFLELKDMLYILGLNLDYILLSEDDKKLYNEYNEAKASKDFEKSDNLRKLLIEKNIL